MPLRDLLYWPSVSTPFTPRGKRQWHHLANEDGSACLLLRAVRAQFCIRRRGQQAAQIALCSRAVLPVVQCVAKRRAEEGGVHAVVVPTYKKRCDGAWCGIPSLRWRAVHSTGAGHDDPGVGQRRGTHIHSAAATQSLVLHAPIFWTRE
eukprot:2609084-Amphidinium_carterae.1